MALLVLGGCATNPVTGSRKFVLMTEAQEIARDVGHDIVVSNTLAIMNGYPVNEQPRSGDRIKIVVEG